MAWSEWKKFSGDVHFFDKIFPDYTIDTFLPSSYLDIPSKISKTSDYWKSYMKWGESTLSLCHVNNCINYDEIDSIEIEYVRSTDNPDSPNTFYCLDANGSTLTSISLNSYTRTTAIINTSSFSGIGKFKLTQLVGGSKGSGYSSEIIIYNIELKP